MRRLSSLFRSSVFLSSAVVAGVSYLSSSALAINPSDYSLQRTFTLPAANDSAGGNVLFDALPDGRLLALNGSTVLRETAVKSGTFTTLGTIGNNFSAPYGPSFLTISPDGTKAAVGTNGAGTIAVFDTATPANNTNYAAYDADGAWIDNNRLGITNFGNVEVLNTATSTVKTVISNVGGASGGIAFDAAGNLYTGNGGDFTIGVGTSTGWIKGFSKASWEAAAATNGTPLDFENGGVAVADFLSASTLGFDRSGNFYAAGADFFSGSDDYGYAALVSAASLQAAFLSNSTTPVIVGANDPALRSQFPSPAATIDGQFPPAWAYNDATGDLYLRYIYGNGPVSVYNVPEPTSLAGLFLAGLAGLRRRRRTIAGVAVVAAAASLVQTAQADDPLSYATEVVATTNMPATGLYNDPAAVLGRPTTKINTGTIANPVFHRAKLIEAAFNTGLSDEKLITTFNVGQSVTVKMGRPVTDDPSHPFGIDLNVFGNAFYTPGGFTGDDVNLNTTTLGSAFTEPVRVSVSPDNAQWYSYALTGDGIFPTNAYRWNRPAAAWSEDLTDPHIPVNPAYRATLVGMNAADALDLYAGSAGGAGYDLAESGFASIQYVRFDGLTGFSGGEIDAVAAVPEPTLIGAAGLLAIGALRRVRA